MPRSIAPASRRAIVLAVVVAFASGAGVAAGSAPPVPPLSSNGNPPACKIADKPAKFTTTSAWSRTIVDWIWKVGSGYKPPVLVPVSRAGLGGTGSVRSELIPDLKAMASAARAAGAPLGVQSAYRSYSSQVATFNMWVARYGYATAIIGSARPGHSEHQLGTTLDFKSAGGGAPWAIGGYDWATSKAGRWMLTNAWKYGFVLSYPKGKKSTVCYGYEPWHYRYFGRTVARAIHLSGLTTRVWLWRHGTSPITVPQPTPTPLPTPTPSPSPSPSPATTPSPSPTESATPNESPSEVPSASPTDSPMETESASPGDSVEPSTTEPSADPEASASEPAP